MTSPCDIEFWLDVSKYSAHSNNGKFDINLIKLSSIRKTICNFVKILTCKNIPVKFSGEGKSVTNGSEIYISSDIYTLDDFSAAVGLALHESTHCIKTNFTVLSAAFANVPKEIFDVSDKLNIPRPTMEKFMHTMFNIIEDRYIDDFIINTAPGYKHYYVKLYDKYFNSDYIDTLLKSDNFKFPSLASYEFRIMNFTNVNTDLNALPELDTIAKLIDITNISRLKKTKHRIELAFEVTKVVLGCIEKTSDHNDIVSGNDPTSEAITEISHIISDTPPENSSKKSPDIISKTSFSDTDDEELNAEAQIDIESQRKFTIGNIDKESLTSTEQGIMDMIEDNGIDLVFIDSPMSNSVEKIKCIVVKKLTESLLFSGKTIFPMSVAEKFGESMEITSPPEMTSAINDGILLGKRLGRKLNIRNEVTVDMHIHKSRGKLYKKHLYKRSYDAKNIFSVLEEYPYRMASIHISVDASSSMALGSKWCDTISMVVAICKATSMVGNIHTSVSFRTTHDTIGGTSFPYVVIAYDSKKDSFNKIKKLFPYLCPNGYTPEGLAYSSTMGLFSEIAPDEIDKYLINLSDGEPFFICNNGIYKDSIATEHTRKQINNIKGMGVSVLSYFISNTTTSDLYDGISNTEKNFKHMYGKDAKFISTDNLSEIASTLTSLFLKKNA